MIEAPDAPLGFAALPAPLRARIEAELAPGERLLWASTEGSKPEEAIASWSKPGSIAVVSIASCLVCSHLTYREWREQNSSGVEGLFFGGLLAGTVGLISGIVSYNRWSERRANRRQSHRKLYALTNRRVIQWSARMRADAVEIFTIHPALIQTVHRLEYPDGTGEVRFDYANNAETESALPAALYGLADVRRIEGLIRAMLVGFNPTGPHPLLPTPAYPDDPEEPF